MANKEPKKRDISNIETQIEGNLRLMKTQKKYLAFFITIVFIISIMVLFYNNLSDNKDSASFIVFIIMIMLLATGGYFFYKIRKWVLEKNIKTIEKMQERLKSGKKYSRKEAKLVSALLIGLFLVFGLSILGIGVYSIFNQIGITTIAEDIKIILFGAGITAIGIYALILYIRNRHLLNNPKYYY